VTDVIFKAFQACAASQGDCNNLTFGFGGRDQVTGENVAGFGYYEVCFISLLLNGCHRTLLVMLQVFYDFGVGVCFGLGFGIGLT